MSVAPRRVPTLLLSTFSAVFCGRVNGSWMRRVVLFATTSEPK
ncbi:hypothetical protein ACLESO_29975 [Pyxidicoccus sp. 3LG]